MESQLSDQKTTASTFQEKVQENVEKMKKNHSIEMENLKAQLTAATKANEAKTQENKLLDEKAVKFEKMCSGLESQLKKQSVDDEKAKQEAILAMFTS